MVHFYQPNRLGKIEKTEFPFGKPTDIREIVKEGSKIKNTPVKRLEEESDKNFELLFGLTIN